jgi:integrase
MGRRMRGEGSVYERKDGYWVAQYKGRYRYAKTKQEAKRKLLELLKAGDVLQQPNSITVAAFMDRWLAFAEQNLKPPMVKRYRETIKIYIKPNLGNTKLHKLDALTIQQMYSNMLRSGLSPATVNLVHSVVSSAFTRAVKWGVLQHNVIENVDAPRIQRKEVEVHPARSTCIALSSHRGSFRGVVYPCLEYRDAWWGDTRLGVLVGSTSILRQGH